MLDDDDQNHIEDARRAREQRTRLAVVAQELRARRDACPGSEAAAIEIHAIARVAHEHDRLYSSFRWPRDFAKMKRIQAIRQQIAKLDEPRISRTTKPVPKSATVKTYGKRRTAEWLDRNGDQRVADIVVGSRGDDRIAVVRQLELTAAQQQTRSSLREERDLLARELGLKWPMAFRHFDNMLRIARAVRDGHDPDPAAPPPDWPEGQYWLTEPVEWDPDMRVGEVVHKTLRHGPVLLQADENTRVRIAWCIDLALDSDRSVLERVLELAREEHPEIAGWMKRQLAFVFEGCSPIRAWLMWVMDRDKGNVARDRLRSLPSDATRTDPLPNDLAGSATAADLAKMDAGLLALAEELVETFESPLATEVPSARTRDESSSVQFGEDFTWLLARGQRYDFGKGHKAEIVRHLHAEWVKGGDGCGLKEETLAEKIDAGSSFAMRKQFRGHPAVGAILSRAGKGVWALYLNAPPPQENDGKLDGSVDG